MARLFYAHAHLSSASILTKQTQEEEREEESLLPTCRIVDSGALCYVVCVKKDRRNRNFRIAVSPLPLAIPLSQSGDVPPAVPTAV